ncbi:hypothetical protein CAC42_7861 [Sphaceloma murrayae]|uniref:Delta(24)-sterol reductase n=1 Tax=Sphaceloma murrayae TaxID=2082308 RepID=A0A2K1QXW0_9PEZI|nr:hypothetical protein CAC42_7861 [Sphaceloma murrayae]
MAPPPDTYTMDAHAAAVSSLAAQVAAFHAQKVPFRCYHGSTTSTRKVRYQPSTSLDLSPLSHILSIDQAGRTALVEPSVSMSALVTAALPYNLVPAVVPEFTTITVGGCFAGSGGESSSFRHGVFDDTVESIEMILGDGSVTRASKVENPDLLRGAAGSYGSLGVLTLLEVRLVPSRAFVEVCYLPVRGPWEAVREVERVTDEAWDFCDAVLYGEGRGVVMAGRWADQSGGQVTTFTRKGDEWFYMHAEKVLEGSMKEDDGATGRQDSTSTAGDLEKGVARAHTELIPTYDYLFRWDRSCFWMGAHALDYFYVHNTKFARWLGDSLLRPGKMMHAMQTSSMANQYVIQDISVPYAYVSSFVDHIQKEVGIYPLWLCPLLLKNQWPLKPRDPTIPERIMNIGMWGQGSKKLEKFVQQNRDLEKKTRELHGLKCLYAQSYYTEDEFWKVYDKEAYDALRVRYRAETLPSVYDKVCKNSATEELEKRRTSKSERVKGYAKDFWICRGLYGAASSMMGREYLMQTTATRA